MTPNAHFPVTLADLPPPPEGRTGWPWTEGSPPIPDAPEVGGSWPSISIITPSYNQSQYLEETIRSVLLQGYPNMEYFILDGGSKDDSVEIIRKYEKWLAGWVSEKDAGQSDAINKGFARCSGEIFNWLCSDDVFAKGAFERVAKEFMAPDACDVLAGACYCQYDDEPEKSSARPAKGVPWEATPYTEGIWQPSCFWRRSSVTRDELVLRDLHFCMDRELWCHLLAGGWKWRWTEEVLSVYRFTGENKSVVGRQKIIAEIDRIYRSYVKEAIPLPGVLRRFWLPLVLKSKNGGNALIRGASNLLAKGIAGILLALYPRERVRTLQHEFYVYSVW
jgi:glycosyltransferase involved in cell wall biosynthesis